MNQKCKHFKHYYYITDGKTIVIVKAYNYTYTVYYIYTKNQ